MYVYVYVYNGVVHFGAAEYAQFVVQRRWCILVQRTLHTRVTNSTYRSGAFWYNGVVHFGAAEYAQFVTPVCRVRYFVCITSS